jgi:L-ectoine synthase
MIVKNLAEVKSVEWGNGVSRRFLVHSDGFGYSLNDTVVYKGTTSRLQYLNHLESVYCIAGLGSVTTLDGTCHEIRPGMLYVLDQHDAHSLSAADDSDLRVVCVFTPALTGDEKHSLTPGGFSGF